MMKIAILSLLLVCGSYCAACTGDATTADAASVGAID